jgi:hypothetical protein
MRFGTAPAERSGDGVLFGVPRLRGCSHLQNCRLKAELQTDPKRRRPLLCWRNPKKTGVLHKKVQP